MKSHTLSVCTVALVCKSLSAQPCTPGAFHPGCVLDTFKNVEARYNGASAMRTCCGTGYDGLQYQCVEYIRRFYRVAKGCDVGTNCDTKKWEGKAHAKDFINKASQFALEKHINGATFFPPAVDDIIVLCDATAADQCDFRKTKYGHVAVVKDIIDAGGSHFGVRIVEQNYSTTIDQVLPVDRLPNGLYSMPKRGKYLIQGWLRLRPDSLSSGSMNLSRHAHTATQLNNGQVLVTGGATVAHPLGSNTAELYDPQTGVWRNTRSAGLGGGLLLMNERRREHTATKLQDGRVLIVGGSSDFCLGCTPDPSRHKSAEIFDPATETFTPTGSMRDARNTHGAVLLNDGRVLVVGGFQDVTGSAEAFNPSSGTWTAFNYAFPGFAGRPTPAVALLSGAMNGKVLVAGGAYVNNVDLFDPANNTWSPLNPMARIRSTHSAHALPNGKALIVGGNDGLTATYTAELYDPAANGGNGSTVLVPGGLTVGGWLHSAVSLPSGDVFIAGGNGAPGSHNGDATVNAQLYNFLSNSLTTHAPLLQPRVAFPMVLTPSGQVLIPGGAKTQNNGSSVTILKDVELRVP